MKKVILSLILMTSAIFSFEKDNDSFNYDAVGADFIAPAIGVGTRSWDGDNGFDLNVSFSSIVLINRSSVIASYLKKLNDNKYVGAGVGVFTALVFLNGESRVNFGMFPSLKIGKETENHFHEVSLIIPQVSTYGVSVIPLVSYRYGF
jgi:hypothetical protein